MRVNQFIDLGHPYLNEHASYNDIKNVFETQNVTSLPIVYEDGELWGSLIWDVFERAQSEDFILKDWINNLQLYDYYHILEALREFMKSGRESLPVVDDNGFYVGMCHVNEVQHHVQQTMGLVEAASMMVIETSLQNYSMVDVAKIVESNQAKILSMYLSTHPDSSSLQITITLNVPEISDIVATFKRFNYKVNYSSSSTSHSEFIKERYDSFMHFLDI